MEFKIAQLIAQHNSSFEPNGINSYWKTASDAFKRFWNEKMVNDAYTDFHGHETDDLDPVVRILDVNGSREYLLKDESERSLLKERILKSGLQYGLNYSIKDKKDRVVIENAVGAATGMITQPGWYKIFYDLKSYKELRDKLTQIFEETEPDKIAILIDVLKRINSNNSNLLTSKATVALCSILAVENQNKWVSSVSIKQRKLIIKYFNLGNVDERYSYGKQIVKTNEFLLNFNQKYNTKFSPLELSYFLYEPQIRKLWDISIKEMNYFILRIGGGEYADQTETMYNFKEGIPGSNQLRAAETNGKFVYLQEGEFNGTGQIGRISSYLKGGVAYFDAEVQNYAKIKPIKLSDVAGGLGFKSIRQAGILKISETDFNAIIRNQAREGVKLASINEIIDYIKSKGFYFPDETIINSSARGRVFIKLHQSAIILSKELSNNKRLHLCPFWFWN